MSKKTDSRNISAAGNTDPNIIKLRRKNSTRFKGTLLLIIGILFLVSGAGRYLESFDSTDLLLSVIFCLVLVILGIFILKQPERDEKKEQLIDDTERQKSMLQNEEVQKRRQMYLDFSKKHKNLGFLFFKKSSWAWTQATIIASVVFLLLVLPLALFIHISFLIAAVPILLIAFYIVYRKHDKFFYDCLLKQYKDYGIEKAEALSDFAESNLYRMAKEFIYVSGRFLFDSKSGYLIPVSGIVLVFSGYDKNFAQSSVSEITASYYIMVCLENGQIYKLMCSEGLCPVLEEDIAAVGTSVATGYSAEQYGTYLFDPGKFRYEHIEFENVTLLPVNTEIISNTVKYNYQAVHKSVDNAGQNIPDNAVLHENKAVQNIPDNTASYVNNAEQKNPDNTAAYSNNQNHNNSYTNSANTFFKEFNNLLDNSNFKDDKLVYRRPPKEYMERYNAQSEADAGALKLLLYVYMFSELIIFVLWLFVRSLKCPSVVSSIMLILLILSVAFKIFAGKSKFNIYKLPLFDIVNKKKLSLYYEGLSKMELPKEHNRMEIFLPADKTDNNLWKCGNLLMFTYSDDENIYFADVLKTIKIPFDSLSVSGGKKLGRIEFDLKKRPPEKLQNEMFLKPENLTVPFYTVKVLIDQVQYDICIPEYEMSEFCRMTHLDMPQF